MSDRDTCIEAFNKALSLYRIASDVDPGSDEEPAVESLARSANLLAEAWLSAQGLKVPVGTRLRKLWEEHAPPTLNPDAVSNVFELEGNSGHFQRITPNEMRQIRIRYLDAVFRTRKALEKRIFDDLPRSGENQQLRQGRKRDPWIAVVVCTTLALCIILAHRLARPFQVVDDTVQIYWLTEGSSWKESNSLKSPAKSGNEFERYTFQFDRPVLIKQIRLDPTMQPGMQIEVRQLRLVPTVGEPVVFRFDGTGARWSAQNVEALSSSNENWALRSTSVDPYLTGPPFSTVEIREVDIEIRSRLPASLLRWILGG